MEVTHRKVCVHFGTLIVTVGYRESGRAAPGTHPFGDHEFLPVDYRECAEWLRANPDALQLSHGGRVNEFEGRIDQIIEGLLVPLSPFRYDPAYAAAIGSKWGLSFWER